MKFPTTLRQWIGWILVVFIVYAVLTSPAQTADTTGNLWAALKGGLSSIGTFFDTLINH